MSAIAVMRCWPFHHISMEVFLSVACSSMARNPASHARLSLLLILTAGLGVFAASFASTLERSAAEQVLYQRIESRHVRARS